MGRLRKDPQCISRRHCFDALNAIYSFILIPLLYILVRRQHSLSTPLLLLYPYTLRIHHLGTEVASIVLFCTFATTSIGVVISSEVETHRL